LPQNCGKIKTEKKIATKVWQKQHPQLKLPQKHNNHKESSFTPIPFGNLQQEMAQKFILAERPLVNLLELMYIFTYNYRFTYPLMQVLNYEKNTTLLFIIVYRYS
jgi:hypothetical protein